MREAFFALMLLSASFKVNSQLSLPVNGSDGRELLDMIERSQARYLDSLYDAKTGSARQFIYGREYVSYYTRAVNKPLLRPGEQRTASLLFRGRKFENIELHYDTYRDEVILVDDTLIFNNRKYQVALNNDLVSAFDLFFRYDTMEFRYFDKEAFPGFNLQEGFYEVLYFNSCKCLVRHDASRYRYNAIEEYSYKPVCYVSVSNDFVPVTTKSRFIKMFGVHSDDIRHYIDRKKINIRKAEKGQIADLFRYYESLSTTTF